MGEQLLGLKRTCRCADLTEEMVGKKVTVMGWAGRIRKHGRINFIDLRDNSGVVQTLFDESKVNALVFEKSSDVKNEYVIAVTGKLVLRDKANFNKNIKTGMLEIHGDEIKILSESEVLPFMIDDDSVNEMLRLKYRYLDMRNDKLHKNIILRNTITRIVNEYLQENSFLSIETPILGRSTPEGARDYLVPSRVNPGSFYALPQSPQLYKQLLMIAGFDRYYQIARCFRDEDLRANRQPEFTQVDIEMSFVDSDDVMNMSEGLIKNLFSKTLGLKFTKAFDKITYAQAMENFGSDKPDRRFGMHIKDISEIAKNTEGFLSDTVRNGGCVKLINAKCLADKFTRREIDNLSIFVRNLRAKGVSSIAFEEDGIKSSLQKFFSDADMKKIEKIANAEKNDILFVVADKPSVVTASLGALRCHIAEKFNLVPKDAFDFCWVVDFPLLEFNEEDGRYYSVHHPFTSPTDEFADNFENFKDTALSKSYDLVINGQEAGGGSIRIHDQNMQNRLFKTLGFSNEDIEKKFGFFANALNYGTPPHGGLAFGLDRLCMIISGSSSIKDVIAFPKIQTATCVMSEAPNKVDDNQLKELSIKVDIKKEEK